MRINLSTALKAARYDFYFSNQYGLFLRICEGFSPRHPPPLFSVEVCHPRRIRLLSAALHESPKDSHLYTRFYPSRSFQFEIPKVEEYGSFLFDSRGKVIEAANVT